MHEGISLQLGQVEHSGPLLTREPLGHRSHSAGNERRTKIGSSEHADCKRYAVETCGRFNIENTGSGDLSFRGGSVDQDLERILHQSDSVASLIKMLRGSYFIKIYDRQTGIYSFVSDFAASRPHYYIHKSNSFFVSPSLIKCMETADVDGQFDEVSISEYLTLQSILENRTLFQGVRTFPPGSIVTYNPASDELVVRNAFEWSDLVGPKYCGSFTDAVAESVDLFRTACARQVRTNDRVGIYLSGGLDSRCILAAMSENIDLRTFSFGPIDSPDMVYARMCSEAIGTIHSEFEMKNGSWISMIAKEHTRSAEGGHSIVHAHNFWRANEAGKYIDVNIHGHFGDLLIGGSYMYDGDRDGLPSRLLATLSEKWGWGSPIAAHEGVGLFADIAPDFVELVHERISHTLGVYGDVPPDFAHDLAALHLHGSRNIQYYLVHNRQYFDDICPFLDIDLLKFIYSLPAQFRKGRRLQIAMLKAMSPELAKIPWAATGSPPVPNAFAQFKATVVSRVNQISEGMIGRKVMSPKDPLFNSMYPQWLFCDQRVWASDRIEKGICTVSRVITMNRSPSELAADEDIFPLNNVGAQRAGVFITLGYLEEIISDWRDSKGNAKQAS